MTTAAYSINRSERARMTMNPEYLRRNLLVASSVGALASIEKSLERLRKMKHPPKWLLKSLQMAQERAAKLPPALACYRSAVPYEVPAAGKSV